jgi:hypothetical protein
MAAARADYFFLVVKDELPDADGYETSPFLHVYTVYTAILFSFSCSIFS